MKKVLALVLTLMMTLVATACGGGNEDTKEQETGSVNETAEDTKTEIITLIVEFLAMLGILVDPTTDGVSDSERALTYYTENDERNGE